MLNVSKICLVGNYFVFLVSLPIKEQWAEADFGLDAGICFRSAPCSTSVGFVCLSQEVFPFFSGLF